MKIHWSCYYNVLALPSVAMAWQPQQQQPVQASVSSASSSASSYRYSVVPEPQTVTSVPPQQYSSSNKNINSPVRSVAASRTDQLMQQQQQKNQEIAKQWEAEIQASAAAKTDWNRVQEWLNDEESNLATTAQDSNDSWKVALASGIVMGLGCEYFTHNSVASLLTFLAVFWVALKDPVEDTADNLAGPLARIIGRSALKSYQKSQPKLKAVVRAAIQDNQDLQSELQALKQENQELRLYQERREWIDEHQSRYNLEELKTLAQRYQIPYSTSTKPQLMMRLLQVSALQMTRP